MKISITQHMALATAAGEPAGEVRPADNGVLRSMLRSGLVEVNHDPAACKPLVTITELGRWAVENAAIDPKSCPTWMGLKDFRRYLETRGTV